MRPPGRTAGKMDEAWSGTLSLLNALGVTALGLPVQGK